jgi:5-methyltetrahydrofolate--homocysteine methyltransferase
VAGVEDRGARGDAARTLTGEISGRILVLDGATGTQIQALDLTETDFRGDLFKNHSVDLKGDYDILCLSRPEAVTAIHRAYLEAGADIISTNTFNATSIGQADYVPDIDVRDLNAAAARLAVDAASAFTGRDPSRPRFVAGVMGPTGKSCSIPSDPSDPGRRSVTFDEMVTAYAEQASGLIAGGVDVLLIETVFDTLNAKAALFAVREALDREGVDIPIWVSATVSGPQGRTLSGQTVEAFWVSISHARPLCVGLNCGLGAEALRPHLEDLARVAETYVSIHPNAGLPDELGRYNETPEAMAASIAAMAERGLVNIVGGCCGTTPEHTAALAAGVRGLRPRRPAAPVPYTRLSGLDMIEIRPGSLFVNVGERTNVSGSARFARLIRERRLDGALQVAREQIRAGASIIDVNMDEPLLDGPAEMTRFLNYCAADPEITQAPVMVDSAEWEVLEAGLKCLQGKGVVNSLSLKDGEEELMRRARRARAHGAAVVVMAFDENGLAEDYERKVDACSRAYTVLTERVGFPPQDVILDPGILAVGTGVPGQEGCAVSFIEACRTLKKLHPRCLISGGVSNLSFAFRGNQAVRRAMHAVFLYHAIRAGMDMGIVNSGQLDIYDEIPGDLRNLLEDLILDRRPDALARFLRRSAEWKDPEGGSGASAVPPADETGWRAGPVAERLKYAMVNGVEDYIEEDALCALEDLGGAIRVIEGPLMEGMAAVGDLFGAGKMFLPQVIRSARVMKKAVSVLRPRLGANVPAGGAAYPEMQPSAGTVAATAGARGGASAGARGARTGAKAKVLLATVQGDVHDIGKNIVAVVLSCANCDVVDLGTKVPAAEIVDAVERERPDVVGLSGLITPSLEHMVAVARELDRRSPVVPLMIGGAATSKAHTAIRIDPVYRGAVLHVRDASRAAAAVDSLVGGDETTLRDIKKEHARVRRETEKRRAGSRLMPLEEARRRRAVLAWRPGSVVAPRDLGVTTFEDYPLRDLVPFVDWPALLRAWKIAGAYRDARRSERARAEAKGVLADAATLLDRIVDEKLLTVRAVVGLFAACSVGDDIELYNDDDRSRLLGVLQCLRQQERSVVGEASLCLADFVAPKEAGVDDYLGAFVVSAGFGCAELARRYREAGDDYTAIMSEAVAIRLAEACVEHLHMRVRRELWGYAAGETLSAEEIGAGRYAGIRPAPGYPACPDHTAKGLMFDLLDAGGRIGVGLTESYDIEPAASAAGWYFAHPESRYFKVGALGADQVLDYARRKGISVAEVRRWLAPYLGEDDEP